MPDDTYREIRVRPVVRYVVTEYHHADDPSGKRNSGSVAFGEFENVHMANTVAAAMHAQAPSGTVLEPARPLRIEWLRGPGEPKEAIRWELRDLEREAEAAAAEDRRVAGLPPA